MHSINRFENSTAQATNGEGWTKVVDFHEKGSQVVKEGVKCKVISREFREASLMERII
ncbi:MAG: hypothetical protein H0U49_04680, partial [Parachlamydiaceae bacterium]|nr:hypothetical protein [Parachlamydiaceae bacterium]